MTRKIRVYINTGYANCRHVDFEDLPEDWNDWSAAEQEGYLDEISNAYLNNMIDYGANVVEDEDE